jgi:membrane fusion protein, copper/silver efflux system
MNYPRRTILRLMLYSGASLSLASCMKQAAAVPDNVAYYTCTMHPSVRSQDPHGKCPICGMDLVPVFKKDAFALGRAIATGTAVETNEFSVPVERQQQIGVTYSTVEQRSLRSTVRAVGIIAYDAQRVWSFVARTDGYVEQLLISSEGQRVEKGQPLISIYSPDLLTSERELVTLLQRDATKQLAAGEDTQGLIDAARLRLRQWNVTPEQIATLEETRKPDDHLVLCSPVQGIVMEVAAKQGASIKQGDSLVGIADLSQVWVWAEFYEDELGELQQGQHAVIAVSAFPGRKFEGVVSVISPSVDETTRTAKIRIDIANPDFALRPGMYANVELEQNKGSGLTIPVNAVMPTGRRNIVFVDRGEGRLAPRAVVLGRKYDDFYEVLGGVKEGERVVSSANFLIDAESKVQGALKDFDESTGGEND